ncbi:hypothetical protein LCGC14_1417230, partial [marine sediment metagenome]
MRFAETILGGRGGKIITYEFHTLKSDTYREL